ncbi:hypothetical protein [Saccharothrix sp.]|uniref:hypothetical protein n=1 Tax=Saccharothrix sp. TaxID=1873460 RepID=UPI002811CF32|nr:hypothetical protein [Saccharothrix sp.]
MTERLSTEDFANRKQGDQPADYQEPVADYEQEPTGYDTTTTDRDQPHAVPQQDRQEQPSMDTPTTDTPTTDAPADQQYTQEQPATPTDRSDSEPLFAPAEADGYRNEWRTLQSDFVDDPRDAVRRADELVAQVVQSLATTFADHKRSLEGQWQQGEQVDTEELRMALRRYRAFFDRLLSV